MTSFKHLGVDLREKGGEVEPFDPLSIPEEKSTSSLSPSEESQKPPIPPSSSSSSSFSRVPFDLIFTLIILAVLLYPFYSSFFASETSSKDL